MISVDAAAFKPKTLDSHEGQNPASFKFQFAKKIRLERSTINSSYRACITSNSDNAAA